MKDKDNITVCAIMSVDCCDEGVITKMHFTDYTSGEASYLKAKYESYEKYDIKIVSGTIRGFYGSNSFNTYTEFSSILDDYLNYSKAL